MAGGALSLLPARLRSTFPETGKLAGKICRSKALARTADGQEPPPAVRRSDIRSWAFEKANRLFIAAYQGWNREAFPLNWQTVAKLSLKRSLACCRTGNERAASNNDKFLRTERWLFGSLLDCPSNRFAAWGVACARRIVSLKTRNSPMTPAEAIRNYKSPVQPTEAAGPRLTYRKRWLALSTLCLGVVMIVLDTTIVNVALSSIRTDLGFSETSLVWVVNGYMLTFAGFLLLGGRLGDLYGHRLLFIVGLVTFTLASLACGLATSQSWLISARALQGLGGAVVSAIALSLITNLFPEPDERARAMGVYGFVCAGGGSIGVLLGGLLTSALNWHWIFLVNLPIGAAVLLLTLMLVPKGTAIGAKHHLDLAGAFTVTTALMLAVYAIVNGNEAGWMSARTLVELGAAALLFGAFIAIEARARMPLMPLGLFALRNVATANLVGVLWAAAMFAWFFISALYLQLVLGYSALQVGLAFLPSNLIMAALSLGISAQVVTRFGIKRPMAVGLTCAAAGLLLFAFAPVDGTFLRNVLPAMVLLGLGAGIAFNPVLLAAMNDVAPEDAGLASGVINTSFMMGGALGLAALASAAAALTRDVGTIGTSSTAQALTAGYHLAFGIGAGFAELAALLGLLLLRTESRRAP
jgi:EmrB/QacA subfamily drug resistance transporter